jgi:hypothetical protein
MPFHDMEMVSRMSVDLASTHFDCPGASNGGGYSKERVDPLELVSCGGCFFYKRIAPMVLECL